MDCIEDHTEDCFVDCSLLRNISSYIFFISAASLSPWATRPGCFSRFINFFSSSFIFYLTTNLRGNLFRFVHAYFNALMHKEKNLKQNMDPIFEHSFFDSATEKIKRFYKTA